MKQCFVGLTRRRNYERSLYKLEVILTKMTFSLSIYGIYIAPLQGNYSVALPTQGGRK